MKNKLFANALIILVAIFPLRYAYLNAELPSASGIIYMLATMLGVFVYMFLMMGGNEKQGSH